MTLQALPGPPHVPCFLPFLAVSSALLVHQLLLIQTAPTRACRAEETSTAPVFSKHFWWQVTET